MGIHNDGKCPHTFDGRPWKLDVLVQFPDETRALAFERYLKSGYGCAFAKRHFCGEPSCPCLSSTSSSRRTVKYAPATLRSAAI